MKKSLKSFLLGVILICYFQSSGWALTNGEMFSQFQFNFITPGSRATALGGAFIGVADDATAAESNPAGLTTLTKPEFFLEWKHVNYTNEHIYENYSFDTEITRKEFTTTVDSIPFISMVYPYKRLVFSLYRQEWVNYKSAYQTNVFPIAIPGPDNPGGLRPSDASVDLSVVNYGIGVAVQLLEGLSLAVSPRRSEMTIQANSHRYILSDTVSLDTNTTFLDSDAFYTSKVNGTDLGFSVNVGMLWMPHPKFSFGAVYRSGATFKTEYAYFFKNENGEITVGPGIDLDLTEFTLCVPDSFGAGLAFRATDLCLLTMDVVHIQYTDLLEDFDISGGIYPKENYTIDDITEVHLGIEYAIPFDERFLAVRVGVYHEPDHTIQLTGTTDSPGPEKVMFPGGEDQLHITGGLGLVINDRFQLDTAVNVADNSTQFSLSAAYRF